MLLNILLSMRHKEDDLLQHCFARWDHACGTGRKSYSNTTTQISIMAIHFQSDIPNRLLLPMHF